MPVRKTKSRTPKRFEWETRDTCCVILVTGDTWYLKQVKTKILGVFGYHWMNDGYFSVMHVPSCSLVCHFTEERRAKTLVKKLQKLDKMPSTYKRQESAFWFAKLKETVEIMEDAIFKLPDDVTYNGNEDIPF